MNVNSSFGQVGIASAAACHPPSFEGGLQPDAQFQVPVVTE
jgi:hypothetical protein